MSSPLDFCNFHLRVNAINERAHGIQDDYALIDSGDMINAILSDMSQDAKIIKHDLQEMRRRNK